MSLLVNGVYNSYSNGSTASVSSFASTNSNNNGSSAKEGFSYLKCERGGLHEGENLNQICMDQACQGQDLICCTCESELHANHRIIPLKVFLSQVRDRQQKL